MLFPLKVMQKSSIYEFYELSTGDQIIKTISYPGSVP